jgi:transcriptional regulator with XRE-family HTH domain
MAGAVYGGAVMDGRDYQTVVAAALTAEIAGRGWTRKDLAERAGIEVGTLGRYFRGQRDMNVAHLEALASALGWSIPKLISEVENWRAGHPEGHSSAPISYASDEEYHPKGGGYSGDDIRAHIVHLLANPNSDTELLRRLDIASSQSGVKGRKLSALLAEVRSLRRGELERALRALPANRGEPSGNHNAL